jgi:hypothetical protein
VRRAGVITAPVGHQPCDHLCWAHDGGDTWRETVTAYLREGVEGRERLVYVADRPRAGLLEDLVELPGRDAMLESGQLRVLPIDEAYGGNGFLRGAPARIRAFRDQAVAATRDGYRGIRLAAEASALAGTDDDARRFAAYELLVDTVVATSPLVSLCGYDRERVSAAALQALRFVHPLRFADGDAPDCGLHAGAGGRWQLSGEIDLDNRVPLSIALDSLPGSDSVQLDMSALEMIDVGGLRSIVALALRLEPGRQVVLHDPPELVEHVLELGWGPVPRLVVERS